MKIFISVLLLVCGTLQIALGQSTSLDSLEKVYKTATTDSARVDILNEYSSLLNRDQPDSAIKKAILARDLAIKINYKNGYAFALLRMANGLRKKRDWKNSLSLYKQSMDIFKNKKSSDGISKCLNQLGKYYSETGNQDSALFYFKGALNEAYRKFNSENNNSEKKKTINQINEIRNSQFTLYFKSANYQSAISTLDSIQFLINENKLKEYIPNLNNNYGITYRTIGKISLSVNYFIKGISVAEELKNWDAYARLASNLAETFQMQSNFDSALLFIQKGLMVSKKYFPNGETIAFQYQSLANIYSAIGDYEKAISNYLNALKIFENSSSYFDLGNIYLDLSDFYINQTDFINAEKSLDSAYKCFSKIHSDGGIARVYFKKGKSALLKSDTERALNFFLKNVRIKEKIHQEIQLSSAYYEVANAYLLLSEIRKNKKLILIDSGEYYLQKAIVFSRKVNDQKTYVNCLTAKAKMMLTQKDYHNALTQFKTASLLADSLGLKPERMEIYHQLASVYALSGNYSQAFSYHKKYAELRDSIFNDNKTQIIANLQTKYETDKKEKTIELLAKDNEIKTLEISQQNLYRNSIILAFLLFLIIGVMLFNHYRIEQKNKRLAERTQISTDLHDEIGSTLSSINLFSNYAEQQLEENKISEAKNLLSEISTSAREMIDDMNDIIWSINPRNDEFKKLIERLNNYAINATAAKNITLDFNADKAIADLVLKIKVRKNIYLIVKEAINNAVKHSNANRISVNFSYNKKSLLVSIKDNGNGISLLENKSEENLSGNGLINMKLRADQIKGSINIDSNDDRGTTVTILCPI